MVLLLLAKVSINFVTCWVLQPGHVIVVVAVEGERERGLPGPRVPAATAAGPGDKTQMPVSE